MLCKVHIEIKCAGGLTGCLEGDGARSQYIRSRAEKSEMRGRKGVSGQI